LLRQKKETKEKAALLSGLRLPARAWTQVGSETNSLRSDMFRFFSTCIHALAALRQGFKVNGKPKLTYLRSTTAALSGFSFQNSA
jgi:hypothetical protein